MESRLNVEIKTGGKSQTPKEPNRQEFYYRKNFSVRINAERSNQGRANCGRSVLRRRAEIIKSVKIYEDAIRSASIQNKIVF
jgi:hypothetical protein